MPMPTSFEKAITDLNTAVAQNPENAGRWSMLAWAHYDLKHWTEAAEYFEKSFELDPSNDKPAIMEARCFEKLERFDEGIEWTKRIKVNPDKPLLWDLRANLFKKAGKPELAMEGYTRAIELGPDNPSFWSDRAQLRSDKHDWKGALEDLDECVRIDPTYIFALIDRAKAKKELGDPDGAMADLNRLVEIKPDDPDSWYYRGRMKQQLGDLKGALKDLDKGYELEPEDKWTVLRRGRIRFALGDLDGASADLSKCLVLDPGNHNALRVRAKAKALLGDFDGAAKDIDEAIRASDRDPTYDKFWRFLYKQQGGLDAEEDRKELARIANESDRPWARTVARFLIGDVDEDAFLAAAGEGEPDVVRGQQCEALYYSGVMRQIEGRPGARDCFEKCVALKMDNFYEDEFAHAELAWLDRPQAGDEDGP